MRRWQSKLKYTNNQTTALYIFSSEEAPRELQKELCLSVKPFNFFKRFDIILFTLI